METKHYNIPVFVPEEGCPHRCIFCNQHAITQTSRPPEPGEIPGIVDQWTARFGYSDRHVELAFFGGSFTGIDPQRQEAFLSEAFALKQAGQIDAIRLSTRPDYIDNERIARLKRYGVTTVELGAQSLDDRVLTASGRGHTARQVAEATALLQQNGFEVVLQMMTGLPSDTPEGAISTAREIIKLKPSAVRIYPCLVMRGSPLEKMFGQGKYTPQTLDDATELAAVLVDLFEAAGIRVLRIGLHPSASDELVAGPFHPSFSELVQTRIFRRLLEENIDLSKAGNPLTICCAPGRINSLAGYEASNRQWLQTIFQSVRFKTDPHLNHRQLRVDYC